MNILKKLFSSWNSDKEFRDVIIRKSVELEIGGQRPNNNFRSSWFGKVCLAEKHEAWPVYDGKPMKPLCQINLSELEFKPNTLNGIDFITIFIADENNVPIIESNGNGWLLRSYPDINKLERINRPDLKSTIKEFQMFPKGCSIDYPTWEDCPVQIPNKYEANFHEIFANKSGFKIGGWPTLIQGPIFSGIDPSNKTEYAFQIDSVATDKAGFYLGDSGVLYFGLDRTENRMQWEMTWQCM